MTNAQRCDVGSMTIKVARRAKGNQQLTDDLLSSPGLERELGCVLLCNNSDDQLGSVAPSQAPDCVRSLLTS